MSTIRLTFRATATRSHRNYPCNLLSVLLEPLTALPPVYPLLFTQHDRIELWGDFLDADDPGDRTPMLYAHFAPLPSDLVAPYSPFSEQDTEDLYQGVSGRQQGGKWYFNEYEMVNDGTEFRFKAILKAGKKIWVVDPEMNVDPIGPNPPDA